MIASRRTSLPLPPARAAARAAILAAARAAILAVVLAAVVAAPALACPVCDAPTGRAVRAGIAESAGPRTAAAVLLPLVATLLVGRAFAGGRSPGGRFAGGGPRRPR